MTTPEFADNRDNFCYRHPDRQSFVLCQRCLRTICPECQTPAAVGVICPECMAAERKNRTPAQKRAERRWRGGGATATAVRTGTPVVTYTLLLITSIIGLLQIVPGMGGALTDLLRFNALYLYPQYGIFPFEPWRALTAVFAHGGFIHLALNMLALWMLGQSLEPILGRVRFLSLYLISGIGGSVAVALIAPGMSTVGASGAIFGLMAALLIIGRHIGANVTGILVILGINFVIGFFIGGIAWQAHLGGAVVGALVAFILTRTRRREQRTLQIILLVATAIVLVAVMMLVPPLLISAGIY